jgi:hypothetical protein
LKESKWSDKPKNANESMKLNQISDQETYLSVEMQELANRLYAVHPGLSLCTTPFYYHWSPGIHPNITKLLNDPEKVKKKVYIPHS